MIRWSDRIATGVPKIDVQHKVLIRNFNLLEERINSRTLTYDNLKELLLFLLKYAEWHFGREEECAAEHRCYIAELNRKQHEWYISRFTELYEEFKAIEDWTEERLYEWATTVHKELSEWLLKHVVRTDRHIGVCLGKLKREEVPPPEEKLS